MKKSKKTVTKLKEPKRRSDMLVTKKLLDLSEKRLSKEISSLRLEMKGQETRLTSRIGGLESKMGGLDSRMDGVESKVDSLGSRMDGLESKVDSLGSRMDGLESKMDSLGSRMDGLESKMEKMAASMFRIEALVEEQNIRNAAVLDGYTSLYDHQIHTNKRVDAIEKIVFGKEQK